MTAGLPPRRDPTAGQSAAGEVVCVLSHTHWDREWYHPAGRFRQRLVALVDELLDDADGAPPFLLDGQAIAIEDYLAVRPDRRDALAARLASGAIEAGPWYVLADELIPGGEALVRNLLEGRRQLARLGAGPPAVLYCPDSFGHPAALPAIAAGVGCPVVVLWRGYGGRRWPAGDAARWRGPGGTEAVLFHLPPDGYEFGSSLPPDAAAAGARWTAMRAVLAPRSALGLLLVQNGADHHARQRALPAAVAALARAAAPMPVRQLSLGAFGAAVAARASGVSLPEVRGELRDSYGYTWALQGTFASRARQKRRNAAAERLLGRDAEPWAALAAWGAAAPVRRRAAALGHAAWRTLLRCHPHDTLCGCSTDEVARAMDARLDDAGTQARGIRDDALATLAALDVADARDRKADWQPALLVRNPVAHARGGVAEVTILTPLADVRVGPGSASAVGAGAAPPAVEFPRWREVGGVPVQVLSRRVVHHRVESPLHYPSDALVLAERAVALAPAVGGYGTWATAARTSAAEPALPPDVAPATATGRSIRNGRITVRVGRAGGVALGAAGEPSASYHVRDLLRFESVGDGGDLYTPSLRGVPVRAELRRAHFGHRGPLRASVVLRYALTLPRALGDPRTVRVPVSATLSVDAGGDVLRVEVRGENRAREHRLRVGFASGLAGARVVADAAFGPVERTPLVVPAEDTAAETPPPTAPLHRYVSLYAPERGMTVISDGLAEYEAAGDGAVWVTLVRAVGELSRADLPERPGHAGWPTATPGAQCLGPFAARFGLLAHGGDDATARALVERRAAEFLLPLRGTTLRSATAVPPSTAGVELTGEGLVFSALALGADPDVEWTVARCVNVGAVASVGAWRFGRAVREAMLARFDETPLSPLAVEGDEVRFHAEPGEVVTILVR